MFFRPNVGFSITYEIEANTTVEDLENQGFKFFEIRDFGLNTPARAGVFMKFIDRGTHVTKMVRLLVCPD